MAHMDVVFPDTTPLPLKVEDGRIFCPGIGGRHRQPGGAAAGSQVCAGPRAAAGGRQRLCLWWPTAGEEGLGNLKGSRQICKSYAGRITEFCSFDGYFEGLCTDAVGSERYRVEILTEGGHSFGSFGNRNAIAYLASMIGELYQLKPPVTKTRTTYNVGTIQGGTSVNTIAQQAEMLYEYRSDSARDLDSMRRHFEAVVRPTGPRESPSVWSCWASGPAAARWIPDSWSASPARIGAAIEAYSGVKPALHAGSTDCNIPLSLGIPAVCVGMVEGAGAHTREEYVEIDSLVKGYRCAFACILPYFGQEV